MIREGKWKLAQPKSDPWQLYDLEADRTETKDLAAEHPDLVESMIAKWQAWYRDCTGGDFKKSSKKEKRSSKKKPAA